MKLITIAILSVLAEAIVVRGNTNNPADCSEISPEGKQQDPKPWAPGDNQEEDRWVWDSSPKRPSNDASVQGEEVISSQTSTPGVPVQSEKPEVVESEMPAAERESRLDVLSDTLNNMRKRMEESVSGQKVDLEKYIPSRNAYLQASKEIEKLDTEKAFDFVLQNFNSVPPRIDQLAKAMCEKDMSQVNCDLV